MKALAGIASALALFASVAPLPGQASAGTSPANPDIAEIRARMRAYLDEFHAELDFRWHEAVPGESVQYGAPDTEAEAIRFDCRNGRIGIIGFAETVEDLGASFAIDFANGERRTATLVDLGESDSPTFLIDIAPDDPLLAWMLGQNRIELASADFYEGPAVDISVPTAGGVELLRALFGGCRG